MSATPLWTIAGVATALGVVLCLAPWASAVAAAVFAASFGIWRIVSLASILAAIGFTICELALLPTPFSAETWSLAAFSLLVPTLIVVRHRKNIGRLVRGEEARYGTKPPNDSAAERTETDE